MRVTVAIVTMVALILVNLLLWYLLYKATINVRRENEGYRFVEIKFDNKKIVRGYIYSLEFKSLQNNMASKTVRVFTKTGSTVYALSDAVYVKQFSNLLKIAILTFGGKFNE